MKSALMEIKNAPVFEDAAEYIIAHADEYDMTEIILPEGEKQIWEACAYTICNMPVGFIEEHALRLMAWFQDLNWPGTEQIYAALCKLPSDVLIHALKEGIKNAENAGDEEWAYNLREEFKDWIC